MYRRGASQSTLTADERYDWSCEHLRDKGSCEEMDQRACRMSMQVRGTRPALASGLCELGWPWYLSVAALHWTTVSSCKLKLYSRQQQHRKLHKMSHADKKPSGPGALRKTDSETMNPAELTHAQRKERVQKVPAHPPSPSRPCPNYTASGPVSRQCQGLVQALAL
jgi:hypothetical protein